MGQWTGPAAQVPRVPQAVAYPLPRSLGWAPCATQPPRSAWTPVDPQAPGGLVTPWRVRWGTGPTYMAMGGGYDQSPT